MQGGDRGLENAIFKDNSSTEPSLHRYANFLN